MAKQLLDKILEPEFIKDTGKHKILDWTWGWRYQSYIRGQILNIRKDDSLGKHRYQIKTEVSTFWTSDINDKPPIQYYGECWD